MIPYKKTTMLYHVSSTNPVDYRFYLTKHGILEVWIGIVLENIGFHVRLNSFYKYYSR